MHTHTHTHTTQSHTRSRFQTRLPSQVFAGVEGGGTTWRAAIAVGSPENIQVGTLRAQRGKPRLQMLPGGPFWARALETSCREGL